MIRAALISASLVAAGCADSPLDNPPPPPGSIDIQLSGAVAGTAHGLLHAEYNLPGALGQTQISLLTGRDESLRIDSFSMNAYIVGIPNARHYDEMESRMTVSVSMVDGRFFTSDVNSMNRIDISAVRDPIDGMHGSTIYTLAGGAGGSAVDINSNDLINFVTHF
jgi:hypothetical protein